MCLRKKAEFDDENEDGQKKKKRGNFIPKKVRKLLRKKEKLSKKVMKSNSWMKNFDIMKDLEEVEKMIDTSYQSRRKKKEIDAIKKYEQKSQLLLFVRKKVLKKPAMKLATSSPKMVHW